MSWSGTTVSTPAVVRSTTGFTTPTRRNERPSGVARGRTFVDAATGANLPARVGRRIHPANRTIESPAECVGRLRRGAGARTGACSGERDRRPRSPLRVAYDHQVTDRDQGITM